MSEREAMTAGEIFDFWISHTLMDTCKEYHRRMVEAEKREFEHVGDGPCRVHCQKRETVEGWMHVDSTGAPPYGYELKHPSTATEHSCVNHCKSRRVTVILGDYINQPKPTPENCPCRGPVGGYCCSPLRTCCACHPPQYPEREIVACKCGRQPTKPKMSDKERIREALRVHDMNCGENECGKEMARILRGESE